MQQVYPSLTACFGSLAGCDQRGGDNNIAIGRAAGKKDRANANIFIGCYAGEDVCGSSAAENIYIGSLAGHGQDCGCCNIAIGKYSLASGADASS